MTAPVYNAGTDTLIHAGDSSNAAYASTTAMADTTPGATRFGLLASDLDGLSSMSIIAGKGATDKALRHTYPVNGSGTQSNGGVLLFNNSTATSNREFNAVWWMRVTGATPPFNFNIKFARVILADESISAGNPQFNTINNGSPYTFSRAARPTGIGSLNVFWQHLSGINDPEGDQGTQPFGPYFEDLCNDGLWHKVQVRYRSHSAAAGETVTVTKTGTKTATAVFSTSMAGLLADGDVIGLHNLRNCTISGFDGTTGCTLTIPAGSSGIDFATGTTAGIPYTRSFDGCAQMWVDDTQVMDVSLAAVGQAPTGGLKAWCSLSVVQELNVEMSLSSIGFEFGGVQTSGTDVATTLDFNLGDGNVATAGTPVLWATPSTAQTADHLAVSTEPSSSTASGVAHAVQPAGTVQDASNATVTSDTSTITASWVSEVGGAGVAAGTTSVDAVAGAWTFAGSGLNVVAPLGDTGHYHFADGSLTGVDSATITITATVSAPAIVAYMIYPLGA